MKMYFMVPHQPQSVLTYVLALPSLLTPSLIHVRIKRQIEHNQCTTLNNSARLNGLAMPCNTTAHSYKNKKLAS